MGTETEDVSNDAEMPKGIAEAWANALVDLQAKVTEAEEHHTPMEEKETCENNSNAHPC